MPDLPVERHVPLTIRARWLQQRSRRSYCGLPERTPGGDTAASKANWPDSATASPLDGLANPARRRPGVDPAPSCTGPTWREFLTTQAHGIISADFLHLDTVLGTRLYALAFSNTAPTPAHHQPHRHPTQAWTAQHTFTIHVWSQKSRNGPTATQYPSAPRAASVIITRTAASSHPRRFATVRVQE
jgi:hypothetical protein